MSSAESPYRFANSQIKENRFAGGCSPSMRVARPPVNFVHSACPTHSSKSIATSCPCRPAVAISIAQSRPVAVHRETTVGPPRSSTTDTRQNRAVAPLAGGIERTPGRMNLEINVAEISWTTHSSQPWPSRRGPPANLSRTAFTAPASPGGYVRTSAPWRLS
jgi:hypothetical protein